jgi:hypothetical protein
VHQHFDSTSQVCGEKPNNSIFVTFSGSVLTGKEMIPTSDRNGNPAVHLVTKLYVLHTGRKKIYIFLKMWLDRFV